MNTLRRHRLPVDIISYALEVYCRLKPSHRDVENLLAKRGIIDIGGAIRLWCIKFSSVSLRRLKRSYGRVCRTERLSPKPNHLKRKTPAVGEGLSFGRTRRIRTADLYHVKADWPHQDKRGRLVYVNVEGSRDQSVTSCRLALSAIVVVKD